MSAVFVLGGYQTDFARNFAREGEDIFSMLRESCAGAHEATGVPPEDVQVGHIGNFNGELFVHQGHLGGLFASAHPAFAGLPASRHEAACASGSMAVLGAMAELEAGRYALASVTGIELMRNVDGKTAASHLGTAAWTGHEEVEGEYLWPAMFARILEEYDERYGLDQAVLWAIAKKNFENAQRNPNAQTRKWAFDDAAFTADDEHNPRIEGRIRRQDCGQITDGAATVLLANESYASAWATRHGKSLHDVPRISGWSHRTSPMHLGDALEASRGDRVFPHLRGALEDAWRRAGIADVEGIDCLEVHDCFSVTEYAIVDHLGLAEPGRADEVTSSGRTLANGSLPINPSGGLIGLGHPVGATGVRMLLDVCKQITGTAGEMQVEGARRAQTLNIGGPCSAIASFIVET